MPKSSVLINAGGVVLIAVAVWAALKSTSGPEPSVPPTPQTAKQAAVKGAAPGGAKATQAPAPAPSSDPEAAVRATVTRYITHSEPKDCTGVYTHRIIDKIYDGSGREALRDCRQEQREHSVQDADEAVIQRVSITGRRAVVVAGATGGLFDGRVDTIHLVRTGGRWKVDAVTKVRIDRKRFDQANYDIAVERGFAPGDARCIVRGMRRLFTTSELERAIVSGGEGGDDHRDQNLVRSCMSAATLRRQFMKAMRKEAVERGIPEAFMECATRRLLKSMSDAELRGFLFEGERPSEAEMTRIFASCVDPGRGT